MSSRQRRCTHQRQSRQGSNQSQNRVVCLQCGKVLFLHVFKECDESLIQLADQNGDPLTGQELVQQQQQQQQPPPTERVVEVTKVVRVPAEIRIQTRVIQVPQVVEVPVVREVITPAAEPQPVAPSASAQPPAASRASPLPETMETSVQTEWTMVSEEWIIQDPDEEEYSYAGAMSSTARSSSS